MNQDDMPALPRMESERLLIEMPNSGDADRIRMFYERNRNYFYRWEPDHGNQIYTTAFWEQVLPGYVLEFRSGQAVRVVFRRKDDLEGPIIGFLHYTQMVGGALMSCWFGCNLDQAFEGQGYMSEGARTAMNYLFRQFNVHRINASYMPANVRSMQLMRRLGFVVEGYAKDYLFIDGRWRDHVLTAATNPAHLHLTDTYKSSSV